MARIVLNKRQAEAARAALDYLVFVAGTADYDGDHDRATADYAASVSASIDRQLAAAPAERGQ